MSELPGTTSGRLSYYQSRVGGVLAALLVCTFPVYQNLIEGQLSILILAGSLLALRFIENKKPVMGGVFLSTLLIKPQLAVFVGVGLLVFRQWQVIKGMAIATLTIIGLTLPFTGVKLYSSYVHYSLGVISGHFSGAGAVAPTVWQGTLKFSAGINGIYTSFLGQSNVRWVNVLTAVTIFGLLVLYGLAVRKVKPGLNNTQQRLMLAASVSIVMLIDPHAFAQDVVLLFILLPIILPIRPRPTTLLAFIAFIQLIIIDQHKPIHLVSLSLLALTLGILIKHSRHPELVSGSP
jgi:hypothetical protein